MHNPLLTFAVADVGTDVSADVPSVASVIEAAFVVGFAELGLVIIDVTFLAPEAEEVSC